ncbi:MAG: type II/IV secretion system ATPase subunit [Candidatus Micrarchaeia archaeon]
MLEGAWLESERESDALMVLRREGTGVRVLASYFVESEGVPAEVVISRKPGEFVDFYELKHVRMKEATRAVLEFLKEKIIESANVKTSEMLDPREAERVKARMAGKAHEIIRGELSGLGPHEEDLLVGKLLQEMFGLGEIELLLADADLEEVVINNSREPVMVYHKKFGWLKTNVFVSSEEQIQNYASMVGRKAGRQITNLNPLMDATLLSGSRVNATLYPISTKGNGITIRKFRADPWTVVNFIDPAVNTLSAEVAALIWMAQQYELNVLVGGGTASGKTSFLNAMLAFTPPNQRLVSIEDTRELVLPDFLHWTPLCTRMPNPEGKGEVTMLDLMVNSLRMRPDRIVLGEIRRQREAEVLFEAMHTGHAVYSTLHADEALQVKNRLVGPPISLPEEMIGALHLVVVQYRQRRTGVRRTYEVAEVLPQEGGIALNIVYKWDAREDRLVKVGDFIRLASEMALHTGLTGKELENDLSEKESVLKWMLAQKIWGVNDVGRVVAHYYRDRELVVGAARNNVSRKEFFGE